MDAEYNLTQSSKLLGVDPKTLTKWIKTMGITTHDGPDPRYRMVTYTQLKSIARAHHRTWEADREETSLNETLSSEIKPTLNKLLTESHYTLSEIGSLSEKLGQLEKTVKHLQSQRQKADEERKTMHQKILALEDLIQKHLDQH